MGQPARVRGPACGLELRPAGGRAQNSPGAVSEHSRIGIRDTVHSGQRELPPGEVGRTGSAYGLLVDRELVDRGGISCAGFSCMWSGGTAGYSRRIQTSNAQCKNMLASNGEITAGGVRSCAQRVQDPDRRLQRRRPARLLRARVVRLSRLHVPPQAGTQPVRDLLPELPPGRLWSGGHADARELRRWPLHRRNDKTLTDPAHMLNPVLQGQINYTDVFTRRRCIRPSATSTTSSYGGPCGTTSDCAAAPPPRAGSSPSSPDDSLTCSLTGVSACALPAGRWEPGEPRGSRRDLRAPGAETPPRRLASTCWCGAGSGRR